jgi:F-type H+-transporting ATPase subunit a
MEAERDLALTALFNEHLAGPANALLGVFGITAENPKHPWPNWLVMELLVVALLMILVAIVRSRLSAENPGKLQHVFELLYERFHKSACITASGSFITLGRFSFSFCR